MVNPWPAAYGFLVGRTYLVGNNLKTLANEIGRRFILRRYIHWTSKSPEPKVAVGVTFASAEPSGIWAGAIRQPSWSCSALGADPTGECPTLLAKRREWPSCSPTRAEVDAYIKALERELRQECYCIPFRHAEGRRSVAPAVRRSNSDVLVWGMIVMALGCLAWLLQCLL